MVITQDCVLIVESLFPTSVKTAKRKKKKSFADSLNCRSHIFMVHTLNVLRVLLPSIFNPEFQCVWCNKILWYLIGKQKLNFQGRSL